MLRQRDTTLSRRAEDNDVEMMRGQTKCRNLHLEMHEAESMQVFKLAKVVHFSGKGWVDQPTSWLDIDASEVAQKVGVKAAVPQFNRYAETVAVVANAAKAALVHGNSGAPDSARLVHAFHSYNLGLRARPWFEYVRSKANPADEPSRVDLSGERWRVLACPELVSEPVPVSFPQVECWRDPAGWARLGESRAVETRW